MQVGVIVESVVWEGEGDKGGIDEGEDTLAEGKQQTVVIKYIT